MIRPSSPTELRGTNAMRGEVTQPGPRVCAACAVPRILLSMTVRGVETRVRVRTIFTKHEKSLYNTMHMGNRIRDVLKVRSNHFELPSISDLSQPVPSMHYAAITRQHQHHLYHLSPLVVLIFVIMGSSVRTKIPQKLCNTLLRTISITISQHHY